ncbi:uncharacterized protein LOC8279547 isoform X1 [Ricinus communis]|uniref:uncharacterized protein LOC8279547 isoform X1 n=2 Tax=Ricinus communis TaxID=3988 RepID=UPI0007723A04|nr:uncharacterized protein LOC8279547 isoform X1 [Ricinus communis]|eukprot:XP_015574576.1 uncharacterized protein LOC8279547 isoform X1 [Ricinus communis]
MHEVKWRGGATLNPFNFVEVRFSRHKRSNSDPAQRKVEKHKPNSIFESSLHHRLEKMGQVENYVEAKKMQAQNTEVRDSLKYEILALQDRLQHQFVTRQALEKAMNNTPFSYDTVTDKSIPKAAKQLIKDIALLELEVVHLERYLLSLYRKTFDQQVTPQSTIDERCKMNSSMQKKVLPVVPRQDNMIANRNSVNHSSCLTRPQDSSGNQTKQFNGTWGLENLLDSSIYRCHSSISQRSTGTSPPMKSMASAADSYHSLPLSMLEQAQNNHSALSLAVHLGTYGHSCVPETPNLLSEEMIKCISAIYCDLADPPLTDHDYPPSPASFSSSPNEFPAQGPSEMWTPEHNYSSFSSTLDNPFHIGDAKDLSGPYCTMAKVERICRDNQHLKDKQNKLQEFRSLVSQLEAVDPRKLKREEKLAFWINVHNALVMHAFLVYGVPQNNMKRMSLQIKAAYNVGGHTINVDMIQSSILGCRLPRPGQWLQKLFPSKTKFKAGDPRKAYSIDYTEPRLHFALCAGSCSDPALRVYTPKSVFEDLEAAKEEYIQSTLIVHKEKKLHLPKLVESFAKDSDLCSAGLLDMIEHLLPHSWRKSVQQCQHRKSSKTLEWIPHNFTFRYLLSKELA